MKKRWQLGRRKKLVCVMQLSCKKRIKLLKVGKYNDNFANVSVLHCDVCFFEKFCAVYLATT